MVHAFFEIATKLAPLYLLIFLGAVSARFLRLRAEPFGVLLIYVLSPGIVLCTFWGTALSGAQILYALVLTACCAIVGALAMAIARFGLPPAARGVIGFACGSGNTGYFGIPVSLVIFGSASLPLAILASFGFILFENTLGFYWVNRGKYAWSQALWRVARLPAIYALIAGVLLRHFGVPFPAVWREFGVSLRGAYSVLGVLLVGMGIGALETTRVNLRYIGAAIGLKILLWPAVVLAAIFVDQRTFHFFDPTIYRQMRLVSLAPLPAVSVAIAAMLRVHPEDTALAVFLSTIAALLLTPAALVLGYLN